MKKSIIFIFGALLALGACTKTAEMPEGTSDSKALKFRLAVNTPTKGDVAYKGINAAGLSQNVVFASVRKDNGEIQKSLFYYNDDPAYGYFDYDSGESKWLLKDPDYHEVKYLPKGWLMDLVALGSYTSGFEMSNYYLSPSDYSSTYADALVHGFSYSGGNWAPKVREDSKSIDQNVYFIGVDTYQNQNDVVYAVKNGIAADGSTHTVTLKHAQALININIKVADAIPDYVENMCLAFIGANTSFSNSSYSDYFTMKDYILGECTSHFLGNFMSDAEADNKSKFDDYLPLKTVGSFVIDNSLNTPVVRWQFPELSVNETWTNLQGYTGGASGDYEHGGYAVLSNKEQNYSEFNSSASDSFNDPMDLFNGLNSGSPLAADTYYQAAGQLIPEQKIVNPWIYFTVDDKPYLTEVNLPKGVWQAGHVYTYNLTLSFAGPKFDVVVADYVSPFEVIDATL